MSSSGSQTLTNSYSELMAGKQQIERSLNDYESINRKYEDSMLYADQNRSHYMLWSAFTIFITFYLFKIMLFPGSEMNIFRMLFWFFFIMLFLLSGLNMDKGHGLLLWVIIGMLFLFIQTNVFPSP